MLWFRPVPDDDRTRRRLGDATKERIADLAEGWSVDQRGASATPEAAPAPAGRKKPRTVPPPPPGSAERKQLEAAMVEIARTPEPVRSKPATAPPPAPRAKPVTVPPAIPPIPARAKSPTVQPAAKPPPRPPEPAKDKTFTKERTPPVIVDRALTEPPADRTSNPNLAVPVGEFDSGVATVDDGRLRAAHSQATVKRDAAEALLQIPERVEPRSIEARGGDDARGDATEIQSPAHAVPDGKTVSGGRLRKYAALRRQRGVVGDVRYVFTATLGLRRSRRELAELEQRHAVRQASRRRHLVTLGRTAVAADTLEHAALAIARDALADVEDERSKHAGAVAAADSELERVRRDRATKQAEHTLGIGKCEAELADLAKKLEPLEKEAAAARRRADELRAQLARIDRQLAETEASLVSVKADKDPAVIRAELATLRADRTAVQRDEPKIAAELDALSPRLAALEAARSEAQKRRRELDEAETEDKRRAAELLEAIGAKRKVVDRAASDAETARDRVLFELGERLYVDRPAVLAAQLSPIDAIDLELGETDRRIMELREILSSLDKAKLARGITVIVLALATVALIVASIFYLAA
jgi:hypothetical protein